jgi:hypothetical protein
MRSLLDASARDAVLRRIGTLRDDGRPLWGRMSAGEMVCHLSQALEQALGESNPGPPKGPFKSFPINWLMIHAVPWPKGKAQSPRAFLTQRPASWDADVGKLRSLIERFGARRASEPWPPSIVFGKLSGRSYGVLFYKHIDHHLRQFGV